MIVVVSGIFVFLTNAPSKKLLVKPAGAILIGCAQVSHAECAGNAFNAEAAVAFRLPHGENSPRWVLRDCHAPDVVHIKWFGNHFRAKSGCTIGSTVRVLDRNVK